MLLLLYFFTTVLFIIVLISFLSKSAYLSKGMIRCFGDVEKVGLSTQRGKLRVDFSIRHQGEQYKATYVFSHKLKVWRRDLQLLASMIYRTPIYGEYKEVDNQPWITDNSTITIYWKPGSKKAIPTETLKPTIIASIVLVVMIILCLVFSF